MSRNEGINSFVFFLEGWETIMVFICTCKVYVFCNNEKHKMVQQRGCQHFFNDGELGEA
jgi:hypothetical protein